MKYGWDWHTLYTSFIAYTKWRINIYWIYTIILSRQGENKRPVLVGKQMNSAKRLHNYTKSRVDTQWFSYHTGRPQTTPIRRVTCHWLQQLYAYKIINIQIIRQFLILYELNSIRKLYIPLIMISINLHHIKKKYVCW